MVEYRLLRANETDAVARLHRVAGASMPGYDPTAEPWEQTRRIYRDAFGRGPIWGAYDNDELIGHMVLEPGWIEHLYVEPSRHGEGIGRGLLGLAQRDQADLQLFTHRANTRTCRFYEAAGFVAEEYGVDPTSKDRAPNVRYRWRRLTLGAAQP